MANSSLSDTVRRTSDILKLGASKQVLEYERSFSSLKNLYEDLVSNLVVADPNFEEASETAKEFFGSQSLRFAGIDGTMYSRPLFDLVIFFGGAYASTGTITLTNNNNPTIGYDKRTMQQGTGISSVVPIYINKVPDIDHAFFEGEQTQEAISLGDEAIINNATIANWIMTFAEYYLAYQLAIDPKQNIRVLLLDRSLSIDRASFLYDTSKRKLWKAKSSLIGYEIEGERIDRNDLAIARQYVCNDALGLPPPRGDYLRYAIIHLLRREGALTKKQMMTRIEIIDEKRKERVRRYLKRLVDAGILACKNETYTLNEKYTRTWERMKTAIKRLGDQLFFIKEPPTKASNLLKILKDGEEHWLTTLDIAFLTLCTLNLLMEECWKRRILLIGMTKDTAARDFKRQLVPLMQDEGLLKGAISRRKIQELPNTDRMILQSVSILNPDKIVPPWSLVEYDSAFKTMVVDRKNRRGYVSGAIKNRIGLEKTFLKTYVQLSKAKTDPFLRSNVLLVDRLVHPEYDCKPESVVEFWNEFGAAEEPVQTILFTDRHVPNKLQNLIMTILASMAPSSIPEAFGHNKPLFIADKIAKWNYSQFKHVVDTTANWILQNHKLRRFIFYMSTFRERRATVEATRRESIQ